MIENIARKPLPAGPCEGPERWRQADLFQLLLRLQPKLMGFACQMKAQFRHMRRMHDAGIVKNEAFGIGPHRSGSMHGKAASKFTKATSELAV